MNASSILMLAAVTILVILAVRHIRKRRIRRCNGGCSGRCSGRCNSGCSFND